MKYYNHKKNFLAIENDDFCSYEKSKYVIQSAPYEYTSSYLAGSFKGPAAMIKASQFVELYDEELDQESYLKGGICTLHPMDFTDRVDLKAVKHIEKHTQRLLADNKFPVTLGAEHTITYGTVRAVKQFVPDVHVLQIDAHSDLRQEYHGNKYSHASVMARIHDLEVPLTQIGIRAQCIEESQLIKDSANIHTFYAHNVRQNPNWAKEALKTLGENVYISIDADGFDPSIVPAVGTAEPNGMLWNETIEFLKMVIAKRNVVGFDVVEIAPVKGNILTEYTMAKLIYKLIGYQTLKDK
ncbi:MAG: agmatinase [Bacteroidetes bacterium B1(2017)]|nr:MAG: agmatinase [Bacteroidetes bacterium B1(2017)]